MHVELFDVERAAMRLVIYNRRRISYDPRVQYRLRNFRSCKPLPIRTRMTGKNMFRFKNHCGVNTCLLLRRYWPVVRRARAGP